MLACCEQTTDPSARAATVPISMCSGPFVLRVAGLEDGGGVGPHSSGFDVEQAPQAPASPVVTARMADSVTYTAGYGCVLPNGTALTSSAFEFRILVWSSSPAFACFDEFAALLTVVLAACVSS